VSGVPLTVYGGGGQTRGYLNLRDTLQCVRLAAENPAKPGELKIFNQFTETFTVNELAERVKQAGNQFNLNVKIKSIPNPRTEKEEHYYNPTHSGLIDLGLKPHYMTEEVLCAMLERILENRDSIVYERIMPRVRWS
jgi:UDP-sulfoquinovose synthase